MHTTRWPSADAPYEEGTNTVVFHHDGVLKGGDVIICVPGSAARTRIPADAIISLVADYVRDERIGALEEASDAEILGLKEKRG